MGLISSPFYREMPSVEHQTFALQLVPSGWDEMLIIYFHFLHWKSAGHTLTSAIDVPY